MRIDNKSAYVPSRTLYPIVDFVAERTTYTALATLEVIDTSHEVSGGMAYKQRPDITGLSLIAPSLIRLYVSHHQHYPKHTVHVPQVGVVALHNQIEEFLFVLAHESAHIDQFWNPSYSRPGEAADEIDAERFAFRLLSEWRHPGRSFRYIQTMESKCLVT
jgi:hypothetical protein